MIMNKKLQQGDVILEPVNYAIKGEKLNHLTLAEGESTGHYHRIESGLGQLIMMDKIMHLQIFSDTALLRHEEHNPINVPKGDYKIKIVREYDPFDDEIRQVRD
jgi:hypothetical protein